MKFKEIISRVNGFNIPIFGISWNPPPSHITVARKVITFLEDRRVLYNPYDLEDPHHCTQSVIEIRKYLTSELGNLTNDKGLPQNLRAMRAACRKFLDAVNGDGRRPRLHYGHGHLSEGWLFNSALGELRGIIGIHVAALAVQHGLDVEGELASILPAEDDPKKE